MLPAKSSKFSDGCELQSLAAVDVFLLKVCGSKLLVIILC